MSETTVTRIVWHLNAPDLFERWEQDDLDTVDQDASGDRYVEMVNAALKSAYPGAEVVARVERNATGWCPEPTVESGEVEADNVEVMYVQDTIGRVFADQQWLVTLPRPSATSFRLSPSAHRKLTELAEVFGSKVKALELAIDRLHRDEIH